MDHHSLPQVSPEKTTTVRIYEKDQKTLDELAAGQNVSKAEIIGEALRDRASSSSSISTDKMKAVNHLLSQLKMVFVETETERTRLSKSHIYSEDEFKNKMLTQKVELEQEILSSGAQNRELSAKVEKLSRELATLKEEGSDRQAEFSRLARNLLDVQKNVTIFEQRNHELEAMVQKQKTELKDYESLKDKYRSLDLAFAKQDMKLEAAERELATQKSQFEERFDLTVRTMRAEKDAEIQKRERQIAELQR